jgi:hypothetical protein
MFGLKSRYLILWSLEILSGQQRFHSMGLLMRKERYYHPLSVLPKVVCIVGFVLNF